MASSLVLRGGLLVTFVLLQTFQLGRSDFCTNTLALSSCPDLATYDQIDLSAYGGKWYEIGSTANFKNLMESGGVCAEAQYTATGSSKFKVVNTNFLTATPAAIVSVGSIAGSSALVCSQARAICSEISTDDSLLKEGLAKVVKFQSDISGSFPTESGSVAAAAAKIQQASDATGPLLDQLADYVSQLQTTNSELSQTDGDVSSQVSSLQTTLGLANAQVTTVESQYKIISSAQLDLISVAKSLFAKGGSAVAPSLTLTDAATEVLAGAKIIEAEVGGMTTSLAAVAKSLDSVLKDTMKPFYNVSSISGTAAVNGSEGKLSVTFEPLPGKLFPGKYWILAVDGASSKGYNAALVYSCMDALTGGAIPTLWILARTPSLAQTVITGFLNLATSMGIHEECDSPFVYTVRSPKCPA